jgi:hypothetical protein
MITTMFENVRLFCPIIEHKWHKVFGANTFPKYVIIGGVYRQFMSRKLSVVDITQVIRNEYFYIEALCCMPRGHGFSSRLSHSR